MEKTRSGRALVVGERRSWSERAALLMELNVKWEKCLTCKKMSGGSDENEEALKGK